MEYYIIHDENGFLDGGHGRINRSEMPDGSTLTERIPLIVAKKPGRCVVYLPGGTIFDPTQHKIKNGAVADLDQADHELIAEDKKKIKKTLRDKLNNGNISVAEMREVLKEVVEILTGETI
jgi:hypothetical protein